MSILSTVIISTPALYRYVSLARQSKALTHRSWSIKPYTTSPTLFRTRHLLHVTCYLRSYSHLLVRKDNEEEAELKWFGEVDADGDWKVEYKASMSLHTAKARPASSSLLATTGSLSLITWTVS